jgi:beta-glucosidase
VNQGERAGEEVAQLYVRDEVASVTRPVQELRGFLRLRLEPGERRRVSFELHASQLAFHDGRGDRVIEPGAVEVMLGASSADIRLRGRFELQGPRTEIVRPTRFTTPVRSVKA